MAASDSLSDRGRRDRHRLPTASDSLSGADAAIGIGYRRGFGRQVRLVGLPPTAAVTLVRRGGVDSM